MHWDIPIPIDAVALIHKGRFWVYYKDQYGRITFFRGWSVGVLDDAVENPPYKDSYVIVKGEPVITDPGEPRITVVEYRD